MSLPASYDVTRRSLHAVAEHVLAAARARAVGRIGLEVAPGGFATPAFEGRILRVELTDLVVEDSAGERRAPLTTVRGAAEAAGTNPGLPPTAYPAATTLDLDAPLTVDAEAAGALARWLALGDEALERFATELAADHGEEPTSRTLWPEHFDLAMTSAEVNYGASPGDDAIPEPYAYVGPWARPLPGDAAFWNEPFGAARRGRDVDGVEGLVAFYRAGWLASRPG